MAIKLVSIISSLFIVAFAGSSLEKEKPISNDPSTHKTEEILPEDYDFNAFINVFEILDERVYISTESNKKQNTDYYLIKKLDGQQALLKSFLQRSDIDLTEAESYLSPITYLQTNSEQKTLFVKLTKANNTEEYLAYSFTNSGEPILNEDGKFGQSLARVSDNESIGLTINAPGSVDVTIRSKKTQKNSMSILGRDFQSTSYYFNKNGYLSALADIDYEKFTFNEFESEFERGTFPFKYKTPEQMEVKVSNKYVQEKTTQQNAIEYAQELIDNNDRWRKRELLRKYIMPNRPKFSRGFNPSYESIISLPLDEKLTAYLYNANVYFGNIGGLELVVLDKKGNTIKAWDYDSESFIERHIIYRSPNNIKAVTLDSEGYITVETNQEINRHKLKLENTSPLSKISKAFKKNVKTIKKA